MIARSFTEAEYRSVAATTAELNWICLLLHDLGISLSLQVLLFIVIMSALLSFVPIHSSIPE